MSTNKLDTGDYDDNKNGGTGDGEVVDDRIIMAALSLNEIYQRVGEDARHDL